MRKQHNSRFFSIGKQIFNCQNCFVSKCFARSIHSVGPHTAYATRALRPILLLRRFFCVLGSETAVAAFKTVKCDSESSENIQEIVHELAEF